MLTLYVVLALLGLALTTRLFTWQSRHAFTAGVATVLAVGAIVTGFSIGVYLAPVALLALAFAVVPHLRPLDRGATPPGINNVRSGMK
jgi:hypothetical protein